MREIVVSGIRSTGNLHLGNYYGALRNFVKMQHENDCYFFIADLHSLTTHPDPKMLPVNVKSILAEYLAAGLDPEACSLFIQSDVPEVSELYLLLNMHAYIGELERTASFKDKVRKQPENVNTQSDESACRERPRTTPRNNPPIRTPIQYSVRCGIFPRTNRLQFRRRSHKNPGTRR